jgi:hypothetical protein
MREIKFRAWDGSNMYEWGYLADLAYGTDFAEAWGNDLTVYKVMQYTGLKDSKGTPIFEGDIVRVLDGISEVFYDKAAFKTNLMFKSTLDYFASNDTPLEVIGNIYEHSHLLDNDNQND